MVCLTGNYVRVAPNRIKELREAQGMTLETLADLVDLSPSYVQRLENGDRNLAVKHFNAFATALKVTPTDLIESVGDGDKKLIEAFLRADPGRQAAVALLLGMEPEEAPKRPSLSRGKSSSKPK
ncbi:helix-turn-helix domain-containing protein [Nitrobacter sp. TKz-YC02]|uniref:helix-turn-helix domain-containing protein n=1 Tax=Nitrobacter sp. TKz-YC02 TaxID=3398704 RepID=UPI003CE919FD